PESKADLCITMRAERDKWGRSGFCPQGVGELVRESFISGDTSPADVTALSRTSPLLRPSARIKSGLLYNDKMVAFRLLPAGRGANLFAKRAVQSMHFLRLEQRFRGQVRFYGLRPESKADFVYNEEG
ncbi:hypothetical protein A245_43960, partial [Pseudomonas syringae pv. actinidiae ICMP 19096]